MIVECHQLIHFCVMPQTIFYTDKFAITTQIVFCRSSNVFHFTLNIIENGYRALCGYALNRRIAFVYIVMCGYIRSADQG